MTLMTPKEIKSIAVHADDKKIEVYTPLLNQYMHEYGICGKLRESAFIATIIWESGSFKYTREIASGKAYEGRKDLGNIYKGDGVKFRGRGLIQLTGRRNYEQISNEFGIDFVKNPHLLEEPEWAVKSACWWWQSRGLNEIADTGDFRRITRTVNGGYTHLKEREFYYEKALEILV
jgi:putative chitinase